MSKPSASFVNFISHLRADKDIPRWSGFLPDKKIGTNSAFYDLHPVIRALLIADGTVTTSIEAVFKEPVGVEVIHQQSIEIANGVPLLEVNADEGMFYREVQLSGKNSGKEYVRAYSLLKQSAFTDDLWQGLQTEKLGMGVVLRNAAESSFRQVQHMGSGDLSSQNDEYVHRTYSVFIGGKPAILITEVFKLDHFTSGY